MVAYRYTSAMKVGVCNYRETELVIYKVHINVGWIHTAVGDKFISVLICPRTLLLWNRIIRSIIDINIITIIVQPYQASSQIVFAQNQCALYIITSPTMYTDSIQSRSNPFNIITTMVTADEYAEPSM